MANTNIVSILCLLCTAQCTCKDKLLREFMQDSSGSLEDIHHTKSLKTLVFSTYCTFQYDTVNTSVAELELEPGPNPGGAKII